VSRPDPFAPVVALDIDGTSGDHHGHFTRFIEQWTGRPMPSESQFTGGVPFHKHLGVSRATYNQAKLAYRQGGMKRSMPAYEGIGEFTRHVRRAGVQLWICTTRPYLRLDNIDPDTRHWLRRNGLQHDAVLYGPHKYVDLVRAVGKDRVVMVYDDLPKMIEQAMGQGLDSTLRLQPYNGYWLDKPAPLGSASLHVARNVTGMTEIFNYAWEQFNVKHTG
jgi:hypothetical protein